MIDMCAKTSKCDFIFIVVFFYCFLCFNHFRLWQLEWNTHTFFFSLPATLNLNHSFFSLFSFNPGNLLPVVICIRVLISGQWDCRLSIRSINWQEQVFSLSLTLHVETCALSIVRATFFLLNNKSTWVKKQFREVAWNSSTSIGVRDLFFSGNKFPSVHWSIIQVIYYQEHPHVRLSIPEKASE